MVLYQDDIVPLCLSNSDRSQFVDVDFVFDLNHSEGKLRPVRREFQAFERRTYQKKLQSVRNLLVLQRGDREILDFPLVGGSDDDGKFRSQNRALPSVRIRVREESSTMTRKVLDDRCSNPYNRRVSFAGCLTNPDFMGKNSGSAKKMGCG